jgi:hypothetical protein
VPRSGLTDSSTHLKFTTKHLLDSSYSPKRGDIVQFKLVMDRRSLRKCANGVELKERPPPTMGYDIGDGNVRSLVFTSPRKIRANNPNRDADGEVSSMPVTTYREASKPDDTLGFKEGWRSQLKEKRMVSLIGGSGGEEDQMVQALLDGQEQTGGAEEIDLPVSE